MFRRRRFNVGGCVGGVLRVISGIGFLTLVSAAATAVQAIEPNPPEQLISRPDAVRSFILARLQVKGRGAEPLSQTERDAMAAFYRKAGSLIWVNEAGFNGRPEEARAVFARAQEWGLDPQDYKTPTEIADSPGEAYPAAALAAAELAMSRAAYLYAAHAMAGRIEPSSLSDAIDIVPERPDAARVLEGLLHSSDVAAFLETFHPKHPQFAALKEKLREARQPRADSALPIIPDGPNLTVGVRHPSVAVLRRRLNVATAETDGGSQDDLYDDALAEAVRRFQRENRLTDDGQVGPATRNALNGVSKQADIRSILTNMERWRWLPNQLAGHHVHVNIPEFMFRIVKDGDIIHEERLIVGKPEHKTPIFIDEMEFVVFNPVWHVPASIAVKEILPMVRRNPAYLERNNLQLFVRGQRMPLNPYGADWDSIDPDRIYFQQPPGDDNALGRVKFLFPNRHSVYMHDTPTKPLFNRASRAYSHGCMRVRNPLRFAEILLKEQGWTMARIEAVLSRRGEYSVTLERKVPIYITYFTLWVNEDGSVQSFADIYGHDRAMRAALNLS